MHQEAHWSACKCDAFLARTSPAHQERSRFPTLIFFIVAFAFHEIQGHWGNSGDRRQYVSCSWDHSTSKIIEGRYRRFGSIYSNDTFVYTMLCLSQCAWIAQNTFFMQSTYFFQGPESAPKLFWDCWSWKLRSSGILPNIFTGTQMTRPQDIIWASSWPSQPLTALRFWTSAIFPGSWHSG